MKRRFEEFLGKGIKEQNLNPYIISEIGVNHEGDFGVALELIDQSVDGGADCVKFQTYKASKLAAKVSPSYWNTEEEPTKSQFELFSKYDGFEIDDYKRLAEYAWKKGADFLTTPFDLESIAQLDEVLAYYKIASADLTNKPLLRSIAKTGKPVVMSIGASTLHEINRSVNFLNQEGAGSITLLHCILRYPTEDANASLANIELLKQEFPSCTIGYSDHVKSDSGLDVLKIAHSLGANVLEKHFTNDKRKVGNDHYHAMDYADLRAFTEYLLRRERLLGQEGRDLSLEAAAINHARRGVYMSRGLKRGDVITEEAISAKRPPNDIDIWDWDELIGKSLLEDVNEGDPLTPQSFK
jgi:sialic acid synthase SpsE